MMSLFTGQKRSPELYQKTLNFMSERFFHLIVVRYSRRSFKVNFKNGYVCVRNIEYPFVDSKYIEAAISALHIFKANCCITVQELKKDIFYSSDQGLKKMKDNPITDLDRKYRRTGGITAKRITNGIITPDKLLTSIPADTISTLRDTEKRDLEDILRLFE